MSDPLLYKSNILVNGGWYRCVESYEQIVDGMRGAQATVGEDEGSMRWPAPIELTIQGQAGEEGDTRPTRVAVQIGAIAMVLDLPVEERPGVEVQGADGRWPV